MSWGSSESCGLSSILNHDKSFPAERRISQPSPLPPQPPATAVKNERFMYMYFEHLTEEVSHSLYAVEIPSAPFPPLDLSTNINTDLTSITDSNQLVPNLLFYRGNQDFPFPNGMRCVQLDSNFYFLGGHMDLPPSTNTFPAFDEEEEEETDIIDTDDEDDDDPVKDAPKLFPPKVYILDSTTATSINKAEDASNFLTQAPPMSKM